MRATAGRCADLHALAKRGNPGIGSLDPLVVRIAKGARPEVDDCPRVIVCDKDADRSWTRDRHDAVLKNHGIQVQLVLDQSDRSLRLHGRK